MHRPKVIVDTNIFVSGLVIPHGYPYQLLRLWQENEFDLVSCPELVEEIGDVLHRPKIQKKYAIDLVGANQILELIKKYSVSDKLKSSEIKVRDAKDQFLLDLAVGAKADYLVSGDDDLLSIRGNMKLGKLKILSPREFVKIIENY